MNNPTQKKAALRSMERVRERDIDRLMHTARDPETLSYDDASDSYRNPPGVSGPGHEAVLMHASTGPSLSLRDVPVFILYACLGVFARVWTEITLYFDFGDDTGFKMFAIGVLVALHGLILVIVVSAWRGKWEHRARNLTAIAALAGYIGCRMIIQL